jgi:hypothetical protein
MPRLNYVDINEVFVYVLLNTINIMFMKQIISISLAILLSFSSHFAYGRLPDTSNPQEEVPIKGTRSATHTDISPDMIQVYPQPFTVGDATVKISIMERIISTSIYTVTGERMAHQVHNSMQKVQKDIPYQLPRGEYLLKLETENGIGLKRILVR